jgi:hypothetical protein
VEQVWSRLAGCFGEALARKFGDDPPPEWRSAIGELNDYQLAQGMRRLKYSGKAHPPALPEFVKLCRTIGHADDIPDQPPPSGTSALAYQGPEMDAWEILANRRLMQYITTKIPEKPRRYGDPFSPLQEKNTLTLVAFKKRWAELMRTCADKDGVPIPEQEAIWGECMRMAEETIATEMPA